MHYRNIFGILFIIAYFLGLVDSDNIFFAIFGLGGGTTSSTTTVNNIPAYAEPTAKRMLEVALQISRSGYVKYTGSTYATQNSNETNGISRLADRGTNGNANITAAKTVVKDILDGDYLLGTDGYFIDMLFDATNKPTTVFTNNVIPYLGGTVFLKGDPSAGENLAQDLASLIPAETNARTSAYLYNDNYHTHRRIQHRVLGEGLNLIKTEYDDAELLRYAGVLQRTYNQGALTDAYNQYFETQIGKSIAHNRLKAAIAALVGSQQVTTTQYHRAGGGLGAIGTIAGMAIGAFFPPAGMGVMAAASMGGSIGGALGGAGDAFFGE